MPQLTILICTHNRAGLLLRTLHHLNAARRPHHWEVSILVAANACSDETLESLTRFRKESPNGLPLRWIEEPTPGKSHALNRALPLIESELVAFVDDDHRVDVDYLANACAAAEQYPHASLYCGRILPDWEGSEPAWVHDKGPYRIYPLPVPRYDLGEHPFAIPPGKSTPGGGNLIVRTELFAKVGGFATDYGPVGHDLGGGEDQEWVRRAVASGASVQYVPNVVQFHYVDPTRLTLGYLVRKAYQRSASVMRLSGESVNRGWVPPYMIRKVVRHWLAAMLSLSASKGRFHLVRLAASLGEIKGHLQARKERSGGPDLIETK